MWLVYGVVAYLAVITQCGPVFDRSDNEQSVTKDELESITGALRLTNAKLENIIGHTNSQKYGKDEERNIEDSDPRMDESNIDYNNARSAELPENGQLFEGDIVMTEPLRHLIRGDDDVGRSLSSGGRSVGVISNRTWEYDDNAKGVLVPFIVAKNFTAKLAKRLKMAIDQYNKRTCIRLRRIAVSQAVPKEPKALKDKDDKSSSNNHSEKDENDNKGESGTKDRDPIRDPSIKRPSKALYKDYITFVKGDGCSSAVGRTGGPQKITLSEKCTAFTIVHEVMHALGILHEQSRPDRDQYIKLFPDRIEKKHKQNFLKYPRPLSRLVHSYNFNSLMHYSATAFGKKGKDGKPAITIQARQDPLTTFGQRKFWSQGDVFTINSMFCLPMNFGNKYGLKLNGELNPIYRGLIADAPSDDKHRWEQRNVGLAER